MEQNPNCEQGDFKIESLGLSAVTAQFIKPVKGWQNKPPQNIPL